MNPLASLLPALYTALTAPPLSWNGAPVPVYEHLSGNTAGHYVLLSQPTDTDAGGSTRCRQFSCTVLLDVVTQFPAQAVSSLPAESLVSQINARLRGQRLALPVGWETGPGQLEPALQLTELDGQLLAVRRLLRYRWEVFYTF